MHRSLIFWSGLLIMGFIVWGWWDSTRHESRLTWRDDHIVVNAGSGLQFSKGQLSDPFAPPTRSLSFYRYPVQKDRRSSVAPPDPFAPDPPQVTDAELGMKDYWPRPFLLTDKDMEEDRQSGMSSFDERWAWAGPRHRDIARSLVYRDEGSWDAFIPHWLILLIVAVPWIAALTARAWWRKRKRSAVEVRQVP